MSKSELFCLIIFLVIAIPSVLIVAFMQIYLIVKYKTISALSYQDYATKKEKRIFHAGFMGFIVSMIYGIVFAIFVF
jgi:hypothetical protein